MSSQELPNLPQVDVLEEVRKSDSTSPTTVLAVPHNGHQNYLEIANERKQEGNDYFRHGNWNEALVAYRSALNSLPKRPTKPSLDAKSPNELDETLEEGDGASTQPEQRATEKEIPAVVDISSPAVAESEKESVRLRSVLNANIGACFVKLVSATGEQQTCTISYLTVKGDHKEAVQACTQGSYADDIFLNHVLTLISQHCWTIQHISKPWKGVQPPMTF